MSRAEKVNSLSNYKNHLLVDPIKLPCGNSVCEEHLIEVIV